MDPIYIIAKGGVTQQTTWRRPEGGKFFRRMEHVGDDVRGVRAAYLS